MELRSNESDTKLVSKAEFSTFVEAVEPRLRRALSAMWGAEGRPRGLCRGVGMGLGELALGAGNGEPRGLSLPRGCHADTTAEDEDHPFRRVGGSFERADTKRPWSEPV